MISDTDLFVNKYVSVPKDMGGLNCAAFVAGIVKGALDNSGFPARCALIFPVSVATSTHKRNHVPLVRASQSVSLAVIETCALLRFVSSELCQPAIPEVAPEVAWTCGLVCSTKQ